MKKQDFQSLGSLMDDFFKEQNLDTKINEIKLIESWSKVAGNIVISYTENIYIKNKKLHIKITSPTLKSDLILSREKLIDLLNKEVGAIVINDIIFL